MHNDPWSSKCEQEGCQGHLGKFDSCRDEALYQMSLDGTDETTGDVEYEGYYVLIVLDASATVNLDDDAPDGTPQVTVPAGSYIVTENSQGFVSVYTYDSEAVAREDFKRIDEAYSDWLDQDEGDV
jgi:hypothetical protein